jgi:hypothetical protein
LFIRQKYATFLSTVVPHFSQVPCPFLSTVSAILASSMISGSSAGTGFFWQDWQRIFPANLALFIRQKYKSLLSTSAPQVSQALLLFVRCQVPEMQAVLLEPIHRNPVQEDRAEGNLG